MFSALPPKADSNRTSRHVRKVPILLQKSAYRRRGTADAFFEAIHCHPLLCGRLTLDFTDACNAYAAHKGANGGGRATNLASLRRFCAIAANVNSNWAPHGPRNRNRPSRKIRFECANSISTRFLSRDDGLKASVLASARATSRASS